MTARMTPEEVRDFWTKQALEHGDAPTASWSDIRVIEMEIREIGSRIDDGDSVLDVGCANGFSTVQLAAAKAIDITGIDLIPEMIARAQDRLPALEGKLAGSVAFDVGDAMSLPFEDGRFDKVVAARVVINLGEWTRQLTGLRESLRVLKPRGVLLLSEASLQGWQKMNAMRAEWGLVEIPMPGFNSYIDEERLVSDLAGVAELEALVNFSSTYYVATSVVKPLLAKVADTEVDVADPLAEWNRWASMLPAAGDYGTQKLFVLRKL